MKNVVISGDVLEELRIKAIKKMGYYRHKRSIKPEYVPVEYTIGRVYAFADDCLTKVIFTKNPHLKSDGKFICEFFNGRVTSLKYYEHNVFRRTDPNDRSKCTHVVSHI